MTSRVCCRRIAIGGAVLLSGCLLLAACSSGASDTSGAAHSRAVLGVRAPATAGQPATAAGGSLSVGKPAGRTVVETAGLTRVTQSIIYTASLTLRSNDVAAAAKQ